MGSTTRHFNALMKKNFIAQKRQPCTTFFQLFFPGLLMLIIVYLRTKILPTNVEGANLLELKHPLYVIQERQGKFSPLQTSQTYEDFFVYSNYTDIFQVDYDPLLDPVSPFFFVPDNCLKGNSFVLPQQPSPIIGVIGSANPVQNATIDYITKIFDWQSKRLVNALNYTIEYWDTIEDFNTYVSATAYLRTKPGVCFAFMVTQTNATDYQANLFFDDQVSQGGVIGTGMPDQSYPAYNPSLSTPLLRNYKQASFDGYGYLQNLIATLILRETTGVATANIVMMTVPMVAETTQTDPFSYFIRQFIPGFLVLIYILPVYQLVFMIVKEKESRCKESMRMMGMNDLSYWLSWFVYYTLLNTVIATVSWAILLINVIKFSNPVFIWVYFWLFGQAVFGQIIMIQSLFSKSKFSGIVATIIYFGGNFLAFPVYDDSAGFKLKAALGILPQVSVWEIGRIWSSFESSGVGINSSTADNVIYHYSFTEGLYELTFAFFFWTLLGLYLDYVLPMDYGTRKHPCFVCQPKSYTCCRSKRVRHLDDDEQERRNKLLANQAVDDLLELENLKQENYESAPAEMIRQETEGRYLRIQNLKKTYDNGFVAVAGLNLKMYQNQIFALLGQNGAGKSTTISMLTGLIPCTDGKALCYDKDMFGQVDQIRQFMGVCPQHDVLFDLLTPEEHLDIFYDFKGGDPALKIREIADLITDVGLTVDRKKVSSSLSGGNKRKLSVAIALCGQSTLVLLDEPTAGMDLSARRGLWDMLKNYRRDRIIILTTHYMDEADVLGDRIGIMAHGKLMCLGTSLFLKKRFGAGYKLTMVKLSKEKNKMIGPYLQNKLGEAILLSEVSSEITYGIPNENVTKFKAFFKDFDNDMEKLGIMSYGMSITTLEDVFLNINKEFGEDGEGVVTNEQDPLLLQSQTDNNDAFSRNGMRSSQGEFNAKIANETGNTSTSSLSRFSTLYAADQVKEEASLERLIHTSGFKNNVGALLTKRFHIYKRDRIGLICEILVPSMMVLVGSASTLLNWFTKSPYRTLTTDLYPSPQRIVMNEYNVVDSGSANVSPQILFNNLPSGTPDFWDITWDEERSNFTSFYDLVNGQRAIAPALPYRYGSYQIFKADNDTKQFYINSYVNITSQEVTTAFPQFMYQSVLKTATGNPNFNFTCVNSPFPVLEVFKERSKQGNAFDFNFMVAVGIALIPTVMMSFILKEREGQLKHMQMVSGMSLPAYWISNFIADILKTYIPLGLIILISMIFDCNYPGVAAMMMMLPWALVPFTYVTSFMFKSETGAQIITLFFHFMICGIMAPICYALQCIPSTFTLGDKMRWYLCICPTYAVANAILWSSGGEIVLEARTLDVEKYPQLPAELWAYKNLGGDALVLAGQCVLMITLLFLIEMDVFARCKKFSFKKIPARDQTLQLDDDVLQEEERVRKNVTDVIRVCDFRKAYTTLFGDPSLAVERISFGLDYGECFALLGVNGAGKSSTFKSLTADTDPTCGDITIQGFNVTNQFPQARKLIGYCPQHDAIFSLMSVEEHLYFYAKLKGIPGEKHKSIIDRIIVDMSLEEHKNKLAGALSGGNKRKLSVAMATLGNPPIILLDEPSAGMDPEARRFMWQVVASISQRDKKSAVILTTHSMEEAEALSTKMGIMVRGGIFKCFGSSQHIKSKFGTGYEIEIKIRKPNYSELEKIALEYGFATSKLEDRVDLAVAKINLAKHIDKLILEQIMEHGLGADLVMEANSDEGKIRLKNLMNYCFVQKYGLEVTRLFTSYFAQVDLIEQCSDFFKFRVPKENKTIGWLFGNIEDSKKAQCISEYSVCQTSLEQIFATFALMSVADRYSLSYKLNSQGCLVLINPDRKEDVSLISSRKGSKVSIAEL